VERSSGGGGCCNYAAQIIKIKKSGIVGYCVRGGKVLCCVLEAAFLFHSRADV